MGGGRLCLSAAARRSQVPRAQGGALVHGSLPVSFSRTSLFLDGVLD